MPDTSPQVSSNSREQRPQGSLQRVNRVLDSLVGKLGLERKLREQTLMDFWPSVVGEFFSKRSRCLFIDSENQMVVGVANAQVGQDLSLRKKEIVKTLNLAAGGLGLKVSGIRFDLRQFHRKPEHLDQAQAAELSLREPTAEDLNLVTLNQEEKQQIDSLANKLAHPAKDQSVNTRIIRLFEQRLRLNAWQRQNGYPICPLCNQPSTRLHGPSRLCPACFIG